MNKKYYANYDLESGDYLGLYPTDVYPDIDSIPEPKIELTEKEWQEAYSEVRYRVINGVHTKSLLTEEELNKKHRGISKNEKAKLTKRV